MGVGCNSRLWVVFVAAESVDICDTNDETNDRFCAGAVNGSCLNIVEQWV